MAKKEIHTVWKSDKGEVLLLIFEPENRLYSLNFRTQFGEFRKLEHLPMDSLPQLTFCLSSGMKDDSERQELAQTLVGKPLYFRNLKGQIQRLLPDPLEKLLVEKEEQMKSCKICGSTSIEMEFLEDKFYVLVDKMTSIQVSVETKARLAKLGIMGDTYEAIVSRLLDKLGEKTVKK